MAVPLLKSKTKANLSRLRHEYSKFALIFSMSIGESLIRIIFWLMRLIGGKRGESCEGHVPTLARWIGQGKTAEDFEISFELIYKRPLLPRSFLSKTTSRLHRRPSDEMERAGRQGTGPRAGTGTRSLAEVRRLESAHLQEYKSLSGDFSKTLVITGKLCNLLREQSRVRNCGIPFQYIIIKSVYYIHT